MRLTSGAGFRGVHLKSKWSALDSIGMPNKDPDRAQFLRGTLDLMILQSLAAMGPMHGYAIAARLEQASAGALVPNMGTLYPGLMRLEQRGLIRGNWDTTENNRQARFYSITAAGHRQLASEKKSWQQMVAIMQTLFGTPT
jgi:PadR family transcriptional regulator, regulatory protein PadR